jgi:hypothetical protein
MMRRGRRMMNNIRGKMEELKEKVKGNTEK